MKKEKREFVVFQDLGYGKSKRIATTMAVSGRQAVNNVWYRYYASKNMPEAVKIRPDLFAEELVVVKR